SKVAAKVSKIKLLQKEEVNLEHYQKLEAMKQTENQIANVRADIDSLQSVTEFRRAQEEANDLLQSITTEITTKVTSEL
ncbi:YlbF family regulator, partial [Listeria monocytogenes]|nr:YlbF family regulator [Listeria monocytogenes]